MKRKSPIIESKTQLKRCKNCKFNGNPYLIRDLIRCKSYMYCEECDEDIIFCKTTKEAMLIYKKRYEQPAQVQAEEIPSEEVAPVVQDVKKKASPRKKKAGETA